MKFQRPRIFLIFLIAIVSSYCSAQAQAKAVAAFPPLDQWKAAVISGNVATLQALYSNNPPAQVATGAGPSSVTSEVDFWTGLKVRRMKLNVIQSESPQPGMQQLVFQAEVRSTAGQTLYVTEGQLWQKQGDQWRLAGTKRSDAAKLQQPLSTSKVIYAPGVDAHAEIKHALQVATVEHKRVLVVFGANWCYDCHVLDLAFQRTDIAGALKQGFEVVHVDVGEGDKNQDIMQ